MELWIYTYFRPCIISDWHRFTVCLSILPNFSPEQCNLNAILQLTYPGQCNLNAVLQLTYPEQCNLNAVLHLTYPGQCNLNAFFSSLTLDNAIRIKMKKSTMDFWKHSRIKIPGVLHLQNIYQTIVTRYCYNRKHIYAFNVSLIKGF